MPQDDHAAGSAFDLDHYLSIPRVGGLALSPDGRRLVAPVATVKPDGKAFATSLWELDPAGERAPRRLTRGAAGESHGAFLADGSLLFTSARPDPEASGDDEERGRLWLLPAGGGEARVVAAPAGGVTGVVAARQGSTAAYAVPVFPGVASFEADEEKGKARKDKGLQAQLFEHYPIRNWDHYLGPRQPHLVAATVPVDEGRIEDPRDLIAEPGWALDDAGFDLSADGSVLVTTWRHADERGDVRDDLVAVDVATGDRRVLATDPAADFLQPACSPDGRWVVAVRMTHGNEGAAPRVHLWLVPLAGGEGRRLAEDVDLWLQEPVWSHAGDAVYAVADEGGGANLFRVEVGEDGGPGTTTRLTRSGAWTAPCPAPDGRLYALRHDYVSPPVAHRLDGRAADQDGEPIPTPGTPLAVEPPGRVETVMATAPDGTPVQSWLVLPPEAGPERPAPLVLWVHGGPLASWNGWQWRWNPQLLAARGYAVLLPNPALSTGFGQDFVDRGWRRWGDEPYTDVMAAVDAAVARPDVDAERTAAMGGSFGGYMANWIAGHTDRFRCIVTHASLWALDQFHGTTDLGTWWEREFGDPYGRDADELYERSSPNRHVGDIRTPMLVIHGELDHRVPVGEALRLWTDLRRHGVPSKFLYFPDENHWVLKPQNARVWYETVFAWLDHHLLGEKWERPELL